MPRDWSSGPNGLYVGVKRYCVGHGILLERWLDRAFPSLTPRSSAQLPRHTWYSQARDTPRLETLIQRLAPYTWRLGTLEFPCDLHTPFPNAHTSFPSRLYGLHGSE